MDFTNRGSAPVATPPVSNANQPAFNNNVGSRPRRGGRSHMSDGFSKWTTTGLGVIVVLLIVAVLLAVMFTSPKSQSGYVDNSKLQAVFLNTGQVYFGNITAINSQYLVLQHIFYLQTNSSSTSSSSSSNGNNVSLVKLGCELHAPYDQMIINMQQVTFWENLQSNGQVAKAVAQYDRQYPHGQTCTNNSSSTVTTPSKAP